MESTTKVNVSTIEAAYNDSQGVIAAFNLNLLRALIANWAPTLNASAFNHFAFYDQAHSRVDIRLISDCDQTVRIGGSRFEFSLGEPIHTEYSYKFTIDGLLAHAAVAFALPLD